jgi:hypothetical protein
MSFFALTAGSFERYVGYPDVTVVIDDVRLAQTVSGLVARAVQQAKTVLERARGDAIGIAMMQAQFDSRAAASCLLRIGKQSVLIVGMIGVHHPGAAVAPQDQQVFVLVQNLGLQYVSLKQ